MSAGAPPSPTITYHQGNQQHPPPPQHGTGYGQPAGHSSNNSLQAPQQYGGMDFGQSPAFGSSIGNTSGGHTAPWEAYAQITAGRTDGMHQARGATPPYLQSNLLDIHRDVGATPQVMTSQSNNAIYQLPAGGAGAAPANSNILGYSAPRPA